MGVTLTDAGQALIGTLFPAHAQDITGAMGGLTEPELTELGDLLERLGKAAAQE